MRFALSVADLQNAMSVKLMNKDVVKDEMLPKYDFTDSVQGKHFRAMQQGHTVTIEHEDGSETVQTYHSVPEPILLDPRVKAYFPDSEAVNNALLGLIKLIPRTPPTRQQAP